VIRSATQGDAAPMNFAFDYVKHKSKPQNDGFYFDVDTPRGHFFTVLDFATHDYANLNPSLQGKLETIVSSFVSVSSFSADLFLGFLAKEINNFVHNLAEQSGGPELSCSAALCLLSDNQLSYFLRGDTNIKILNSGRLQPLPSEREQVSELGTENIEAPLSDEVHALTLQDDDVVLVMTRGVAEALGTPELPADVLNLDGSDSQLLCDSLMKASAGSGSDRTLVVIAGPYSRPLDDGVAELKRSIASLEERLSALAEIERQRGVDLARPELNVGNQFEQNFGEQVAELKEYLRTKAATIDLLELDEKVKDLSATLAGKASTAEVLELQRDVLKLGLTSATAVNDTIAEPAPTASIASAEGGADKTPVQAARPRATFTLTAALVVLVISLAAGFAGGWLALRRTRTAPEQWSVKTSGNQITIMRTDAARGNVTLTVDQPLNASGEQTFSSFADVERYLDTITKSETPTALSSQLSPSTESSPVAAPANQPSPGESTANTTVITVAPGDSLNELARRFNTTAQRLKELNPQMNWPRIQTGQKVIVPTPAG
jgi:LysM repeat protein